MAKLNLCDRVSSSLKLLFAKMNFETILKDPEVVWRWVTEAERCMIVSPALKKIDFINIICFKY